MTPGQFIDAALWFPETRETEPFGPGVLVYKVREKVFALLMPESGDHPARVSLKCEPGLALELRAQFPAVVPGYHLNKRHWNTVPVDGVVPDEELAEMLRHSYERVVAGMRRADRDRLTAALGEDLPPVPGGTGS
ncbi:MmcQ/YjbR family DNA-binding protein [Nocardiopsis baichengensis]|uniref:MmcQ/YjbR family DNA-binding protein n=1 Tax=Nocardiopsis baichengensis TaxID=280240 RepID=UPI00034B870C|nr:MmcQ/YjbR family DNA-binding protein [Nocardiopsis baichengensis]